MLFRVLLLVVIVSLPPLTSLFAAELPAPELKKFTANIADVGLSGQVDESDIVDNMVSVQVECLLFKEPLHIPDVRDAYLINRPEMAHPEIQKLISRQKAYIESDGKKILSLWHPDERVDIEKNLHRKDLLKRTRELLIKDPGLTILGLIFQKSFTSILTANDTGQVRTSDLVLERGEFYFTRSRSKDVTLSIVEAALRSPSSGMYVLIDTTSGEVLKVPASRVGQTVQILQNPDYRYVGENKNVAIPFTPDGPIWTDAPDGTYETIAFGTQYVVKDSKINAIKPRRSSR